MNTNVDIQKGEQTVTIWQDGVVFASITINGKSVAFEIVKESEKC